MSITLATPGVYIDERSVFPNSVVSVPTAVPAFIGYTYKADRAGKSLVMNATRIGSFTEFQNLFGGPPLTKFTIGDAPAAGGAAPAPAKGKTPAATPPAPVTPDFSVGTNGYTLTQDTKFILYNAIRLFYANGGGDCYIVSVGTYGPGNGAATALDGTALLLGLEELVKHPEPTMVVIPEAVMLAGLDDCTAVQQGMMAHCGDKMKSRIAILDVFNGYLPRTYDDADVITQFRNGVVKFHDYGAAYYPWLETSIVQSNELDFRNLNTDKLVTILNAEADVLITDPPKNTSTKAEYAKVATTTDDAGAKVVHNLMLTTSPAYKNIMDAVRKEINLMAPSAAMAGIYCMVDNNRAVWKAPANVGVSSVVAPAVNLSDKDQQDLNVTLSGKSVNAIRTFTGEGVKCWGARTLDGNSQDWRYINVRRTMIFLEQSIKAAAKAYVFEPNDSNTWVSIKSMLNNFLNDVWKQGGLVGAKPEDAFIVDVGLGTTMTPVDILDGVMRITVKVAISHPAEFIVITFEQKMQQS